MRICHRLDWLSRDWLQRTVGLEAKPTFRVSKSKQIHVFIFLQMMCTLWSLRCILIILCLMSWYCFFLCRRLVSPVRGELQGYQPIYYQWFQQNTLVEYYLTSLTFYVLSPSPTPLLHPSLCVWWISYDKLVGCCAWKLACMHGYSDDYFWFEASLRCIRSWYSYLIWA